MTTTLGGTRAIHIGQYQSGTPEFEEVRQMKLGGSEISTVLGLSQYSSPLSLWWQKKGIVKPKERDDLMEWGQRLEPAVLQKFSERDPEAWTNIGHCGSYIHPERPWQLASPDGIRYGGLEIVEAKTAQNELDWGEEVDQIPIGYRCQAIWNMGTLGAEVCWVPVLFRGCKYQEYCITWDEVAQADYEILIAAGQKFIDSLINDEPPPIDGHEATYKALREQHPDIIPGDVVISEELRSAFLEATVAKKEMEELWRLAANEILTIMGKSRNAVDANYDMFAYRKPTKPDHPPYLCPNPVIVKALRPARVISWGDHFTEMQEKAGQARERISEGKENGSRDHVP